VRGALVPALLTVLYPAVVRAQLLDLPPRRRGLDLEIHGGVTGTWPVSCDVCADFRIGGSVGGALVYRALPHLAAGVAGDAFILPLTPVPSSPEATVYAGVIGPTVRGYFVGHGIVDGYVALTLGAVPFHQSGGSGSTGIVAIDQLLGAEIALHRHFRLTASFAATTFVVGRSIVSLDAPTIPPRDVGVPLLSLSIRVGGVFTILEGRSPAATSGE
jgi:hypothetical protein